VTSWFEAAPAFLAALLTITIPGGIVVAVLRLRGLVAVCLAPAISVSIVGVSAIVAPWIHLRWGWPVVLLGTAVTAVAAYLARRFIEPLRAVQPAPGRGTVAAGVVGVIVGLGITTAVLTGAASNPEQFTQGYDSVFHLNATENAVMRGDASSFDISSFILPNIKTAFYPGAWHGFASLLISLTNISVVAATNIMWLVVAGVVWPLGCVFLARILAGENRAMLVSAGALAAAFPAFPYILLSYGSEYPNTLSNALVPIGIGVVLLILRPAAHAPVGPAMALALVALFLPGLLLAQPNGVFSILLVLTPLLLVMLYDWAHAGFRRSRRNGWLRIAALVVAAGLMFAGGMRIPQIQSLFNYTSPAFLFLPLAALRSFTQAPDPVWFPAVALTLLMLLGLRLIVKQHGMRWMSVAVFLVIMGYPLTTGTNNKIANFVMAPWWDNPERVAALLPLVAVPLSAMGLGWVATWLMARLRRRFAGNRPERRRLRLLAARAGAPTAAAVLAVVVTFTNPGLGQIAQAVASAYNVPPKPNGVAQIDAQELALIHRLDQLTTPQDVIANNPYNGSALAMALAGRKMLFPYASQTDISSDLFQMQFWLNRVGQDPTVCAAAKRLGVTYLLDFGTDYIQAFNNPISLYPGVTLAPDSGAFTLVAQNGHAKLYKLTKCAGSATP